MFMATRTHLKPASTLRGYASRPGEKAASATGIFLTEEILEWLDNWNLAKKAAQDALWVFTSAWRLDPKWLALHRIIV